MPDEHYELHRDPTPPALPGSVTVRPSTDELFDSLSADFVVHGINCVREFGDIHIALSGGSTPLPFYKRLMIDPDCRAFPWDRAHLWIVDERRVPFDDERSNFAAIQEILVEHSDIPRVNVHPMDAMAPDADVRYEQELVTALAARGPGRDRLDFMLLGMGADAHTASLFPRSPALSETRRLVRINAGPMVTPPDRVTMTLPLINASRFIAVLVTGAGKRETLAKVAAATAGRSTQDAGRAPQDAARGTPLNLDVPIANVRPLAAPGAGELRWYLDAPACP